MSHAVAGERPRPLISIVTPAFDEAQNIPLVYKRLVAALEAHDWEWVVVDDHSSDGTITVLSELACHDQRVRGVRLSRNFGAYSAVACGLETARGDAVVIMAADLEDQPENILRLVDAWREGAQVVWGTRPAPQRARRRPSSKLYERAVRRIAGVESLPPAGADFVLLDGVVVDAVRKCRDSRAPLFMLIAWLGFRQTSVDCAKGERLHGRSGWTLVKKLQVATDSITAFTERPLRWIGVLGMVTAVAGFMYASMVAVNAMLGNPVEGWSSLIVVVLVLGGIQMMMLSVIGAYVWRGVDDATRRPRYVVERVVTGGADDT